MRGESGCTETHSLRLAVGVWFRTRLNVPPLKNQDDSFWRLVTRLCSRQHTGRVYGDVILLLPPSARIIVAKITGSVKEVVGERSEHTPLDWLSMRLNEVSIPFSSGDKWIEL